MGAFYFDGKNKILQDMIDNLPDGKVYYKQSNVIPYIDTSVFVEFYPNNAKGDIIYVYVDNKLYDKVHVLADKSIYCRMKTPYGRFKIRTEFNGQIITEDNFVALNLFAFLLAFAKEFNYDYIELFKIFGNLYFDTLQDDLIYKKYGWFFDLIQGTFSIEDYRRIVIGDSTLSDYNKDEYPPDSGGSLGTVRSFMYAATIYGLTELVEAYTTQYPILTSYREFQGWILRDSSVYPIHAKDSVWNARFPDFVIDDAGVLIPPTYPNAQHIVLMDKSFKTKAITLEIVYWPPQYNNDTDRDTLNDLIYRIVPANLRVEIKYP